MKLNAHRDITQGSLGRVIWGLALPITISQSLHMLPNVYDAFWLGQLGPDAQAAAGLSMSLRITMISLLMALSLAGGAVVSRYLGARDQAGADRAATQAILLFVAASGSLGLLGVALARPLLALAGADAATLPLAVRYARVLFGGLIAMEMVPSMGFMLSAAGAPQVMLGMTVCSSATLLITEPFLVRWLDVEGAALALVGANTVGMLFGLFVLASGRAPVRPEWRYVRPDGPMMRRILRVALPAVVQRGAPNLAMSVLTRLVSSYGAPVLAAWVVVQRVFNFGLIPSFGLARVAPAMVGQNLGAAKPERAIRAVNLIARSATLVAAAIVGLLALFAPQVLRLFSDDPDTIAVGIHVMRALSIGYLAFCINSVFDAAQAGAGDTLSPMVINLVALWLIQVPLAYGLSRLAGLDADGIWLALTLGWTLQAALMGLRYRQGHWQLKRVV